MTVDYLKNASNGTHASSSERHIRAESQDNENSYDSENIFSETPTVSVRNIELPNASQICDRYSISDRAAAALISATFHDTGNGNIIVDRNKIRRERSKSRNRFNQTNQNINYLFFDGRKDVCNNIDGSQQFRCTEEHITVVSQPNSEFIGYCTPNSGRANDIVESLESILDLNNVKLVGVDGTVVNTGSNGGTIRCIELKIARPVQWNICMLHMNELPLRKIFLLIDGVSSGPKSFTGKIGKAISNCEKMRITSYKRVQTNESIPIMDVSELSSDQKYLYELSNTIVSGSVLPPNFEHRSPGNLSHSRWLTLANRILRLYVATRSPTDDLQTLVDFVLRVYAPTWFSLRKKSSIVFGSAHLCDIIKRTRYLPSVYRPHIDKTIQRNAFYAHQENLILNMLHSPDEPIRQNAIGKILRARERNISLPVREFKIPTINFHAQEPWEMINWDETQRTEPPITIQMSIDEIMNPEFRKVIRSIPCHTQAVERYVKCVSEASLICKSTPSRIQKVKNQAESRKAMPLFESKKDFNSY